MNELIWIVRIDDQTSGPLKKITSSIDAFIRSIETSMVSLGKVFKTFDTHMIQAIAQTNGFAESLRRAFQIPTPSMGGFTPPTPGDTPGMSPEDREASRSKVSDLFNPQQAQDAAKAQADYNENVAEGTKETQQATQSEQVRTKASKGFLGTLKTIFGLEQKVNVETKEGTASTRKMGLIAALTGGRLGTMAEGLRENAIGLESLGITWSKVYSVMRKLSIGYIIQSLVRTGLSAALQIKDMNAQLFMTIKQSRAVGRVIDDLRRGAVSMGVSVDELAKIVKIGTQVSFMNRSVKDGEMVLKDFTQATLETAQATGLSAESIGGLYKRIIGIGVIADESKLRNIGNGIKFISDQSMLSADEVLNFTSSLEDLFLIAGKNLNKSQVEITTDMQAIAGALGGIINPQQLAKLFTDLGEEVATNWIGPVSNQLGQLTQKGGEQIQAMFQAGDVEGVMSSLIRGIKRVSKEGPLQLRGLSKEYAELGISSQDMIKLAGFNLENLTSLIKAQRAEQAKNQISEDAALARQNKLTRAWEQTQDALAALWEEQGMKVVDILNQYLIPAMVWLTKKVDALRGWWNGLSEDVKKSYTIWGAIGLVIFGLSEKIISLASAIGTVGGWFVKFGKWVGPLLTKIPLIGGLFAKLGGAIKVVGGALAALLGPVGLVVAAVVGVGIALYELWKHWDDVTGALRSWLPESWVKKFDKVVALFEETFPGALQTTKDVINAVFGKIESDFKQLWGDIVSFFKNPVGEIKASFSAIGDFAKKIFFDPLPGWAKTAANDTLSYFKGLFDDLKWALNKLWNWFKSTGIGKWVDKVGSFIGKAKDIFFGEEPTVPPGKQVVNQPQREPAIKPEMIPIQVSKEAPVFIDKPIVETVSGRQPGMPTPYRTGESVGGAELADLSPRKTEDLLAQLVDLNKRSNELQGKLLNNLNTPGTAGGRTPLAYSRVTSDAERAVLVTMGNE